jgi:hypothetical protein
MKSSKRHSKTKPSGKKRYQPPTLVVYGDLRKLTNVKMGAMNDGAGRPMTRMAAGPPV